MINACVDASQRISAHIERTQHDFGPVHHSKIAIKSILRRFKAIFNIGAMGKYQQRIKTTLRKFFAL